MDDRIRALATKYTGKLPPGINIGAELQKLARRYVDQNRDALLDAAAIAASLSTELINPRSHRLSEAAIEAFRLQFPHLELAGLATYSVSQLEELIPSWKAKLFEVLICESLNRSEWVGDLHLAINQFAEILPDALCPEGVLAIFDETGRVIDQAVAAGLLAIQLARRALEHYSDLHVLAGAEALGQSEHVLSGLFHSGITGHALDQHLMDAMHPVLDHAGTEHWVDALSHGLPFFVIIGTEGYQYLVGKKTFAQASVSLAQRGVATTTSIFVGMALHACGLGAAPVVGASLLIRSAWARYFRYGDFERICEKQMEPVRAMADRHRKHVHL